MAENQRIEKQLAFLVEADRVKTVLRRTLLADGSRFENDAEHSWHLCLCALLLREYAPQPIDMARVLAMVTIHDLIEIEAGDTYCYDAEKVLGQHEREEAAADLIFSRLPADQKESLRALWEEFEEKSTNESRFANALDRIQPLLNNYQTHGTTWRQGGVTRSMVYARMDPIRTGMPRLWEEVCRIIEECVQKGFLPDR